MSSGDEKLRLFVAVTVPHDCLERAAEAVESLKPSFPGARWTDLDNQHVTLKFLGWTPAGELDAVQSACVRVAAAHAPSELSLGGLGAFPGKRRVRVVWLGLDDPAGLLGALARDLDHALAPLGFPIEERAFTPHLTLARFKQPLRMHDQWPQVDIGTKPWTAGELGLWRSHLSPKGARYEIVGEFPLGSGLSS
jgi:RNA 2',3'-cyclic 3'-phosphodiesterase